MKLKKIKGVDVLELEGKIVFETSNDIKEKAKSALREAGSENVVLDMKGVPIVDSSGIGCLISLFKLIAEKEGRLAVAAPGEKVKRVMELTRLDKIMTIYDNVEDAVNSFG